MIVSSPPSPARIWLGAIRPATLTAAAGPVAVASGFAAAAHRFAAGPALAALLGAIFLQIGTNLHNDAADFERGADTDARLGPARATQRGWLTAAQVRRGALLAFALAFASGIYLVAVAGWPIAAVGLASLACAVLYTGGPAPLAYHGLGDAFVLVFFGLVAVCGAYYVQALSIAADVVIAAIAVGALATAILVVNNLRDQRTDAVAGKRTLVVRYGRGFGVAEYATLLALPYPLIAALWLLSGLSIGALLPLATAPLAWRQIRRVADARGAALNPHLGATARLGLMFCALLALGVTL